MLTQLIVKDGCKCRSEWKCSVAEYVLTTQNNVNLLITIRPPTNENFLLAVTDSPDVRD